METFSPHLSNQKFETPEQELAYLREQISIKERALAESGREVTREAIARETVVAYADKAPAEVLHPKMAMTEKQSDAIVLELSPEEHDSKIEELVGLMYEKGISNVLSVLEKLNDPHLSDDFHRFLVQYLKSKLQIGGLKEKSSLWKSLHTTLYEIALPEPGKDAPQKGLKELVSSMEQFYAGMMSVGEGGTFAFELAVANGSNEFVFYCAVPDERRNLFEKQILSIFPDARISEKKDDYNIFEAKGASAASVAKQVKNHIFSLKTYDKFDLDPLNVLLNSFSKIDKNGEGAAIQVVFKPVGDFYLGKYKYALSKINKGAKLKEAIDIGYSTGAAFLREAGSFFKSAPKKKEGEIQPTGPRPEDNLSIESIEHKISSPVMEANIRIIASSATEAEADAILSDLESAFNQFEDTHGNALKWDRQRKGGLRQALEDFSYRAFNDRQALPMSLKELTTIMHMPSTGRASTSQVKLAKAGSAPAPMDMPQDGSFLGVNIDRGRETKIFLTPEDRLRHFYVIGQTGTGKTTLLKNMIVQDMRDGKGLCFIDPHGSDVQDILALVPPERAGDVIYFDPAYVDRPMALNMLEYDTRFPEQKTFVVNEMLSIFNKLFDMKTAGGPMFEQYFRNAVLLTIDDPSTGSTLVDVSRVLSNKTFRELKLSKCMNPLVVQFWTEVASKAGGEASLANVVPYIVSKFDNFLANDIMRPVIAQEKSSFNFREVMDSKKILLVNLSKGRLGDINANLIGLIIVGKILMSALSRVDSIGKDLPPFYLYIDEFQNITTDSIATILSEARKYKLSLNIAHQFIAQLDPKIKDAVFGNVGSMAVFRVGAEDAEYLERQLSPVFTAKDIMNVDNYNAYVKMLAGGIPQKPFNIGVPAPQKGDAVLAEKLRELSHLTFGRPRAEVEAEVMAKYRKEEVKAAPKL
ncbi:MAG: TraM recognition domain-containing protein [Candidatus Paceibacterota bacterium]|jgi:hypothetical protein